MKYLKLALLVVLSTMVVGCTAKQDSAITAASTEWRIKSLEESFLNFREEQRKQADQSAENSEAVNKKLAEIEAQIAALKTGSSSMEAPDDMSDAQPGEKGWVTEPSPEEGKWMDGQKPQSDTPMAQSDEEKPWEKVPGPPAVIPEPKVAKRPAIKSPAPVATKTMASSALYNSGYAKYQASDFEGARGVFDEFLKKYPKDALAPNALYWKGETYYSQKDYAQAILTFKEVTGRFPKHEKAASALLKIGMAYDKVGDPDNAIFYLRALIEDFPKSEPTVLARKELSRLGG